jgi:diphthine synthase
MGELEFIGAGLGDERDLSQRSFQVLKDCSDIFAEEYTAAFAPGTLDRLATELGRPIRRQTRAEVESASEILAALAVGLRVGFLTAGDPFAATTHVALRLAAEQAGHVWRYHPAASVLTAAAGVLGLIHYRFGRTVTLPFEEPHFAPQSPFEWILKNRGLDLHTLVLLDLRPEEDRFLTAREALGMLSRFDAKGIHFPPDQEFGVVARVGRQDGKAAWGNRRELEEADLGPPMHTLVVPATSLHFEEQAAVARYRLR